MVWSRHDQGGTGDDNSKAVEKTDKSDSHCSFPCVLLLLRFIDGKCRASGDDDKEEEQAVVKSAKAASLNPIHWTDITLKQNHCTPTCAIPKSPATHSNVLTVLQQATSAREAGRTRIFAKAHVPEVVPSRMKYGEIPSDVPRAMIL
jgi:hypothetical protein